MCIRHTSRSSMHFKVKQVDIPSWLNKLNGMQVYPKFIHKCKKTAKDQKIKMFFNNGLICFISENTRGIWDFYP